MRALDLARDMGTVGRRPRKKAREESIERKRGLKQQKHNTAHQKKGKTRVRQKDGKNFNEGQTPA